MQGVIGTKEGAELQACGFGLLPSIRGELDAVVGDGLVDFAVFVAFRLGVADQDDHAWFAHVGAFLPL